MLNNDIDFGFCHATHLVVVKFELKDSALFGKAGTASSKN